MAVKLMGTTAPSEQLLEHASAAERAHDAVRARVPALEAAAGGPHRGQVVTATPLTAVRWPPRYRTAPSAETSVVRTVAKFPAPL